MHNTSEVLFRLCANIDPQRDSTFIKNPCDEPGPRADHADHRFAHGLRRHAETARGRLHAPMAGVAEDGAAVKERVDALLKSPENRPLA